MESVSILVRRDGVEHQLLIDVAGKRQLHQDAVHPVVGRQPAQQIEELGLRSARIEIVIPRGHAGFRTCLAFASHVDPRTAGSSPTTTVARPGVTPRSVSTLVSVATSARISAAIALPSMIVAVMARTLSRRYPRARPTRRQDGARRQSPRRSLCSRRLPPAGWAACETRDGAGGCPRSHQAGVSGRVGSVAEVAFAGEDHGDAVLVRGGDDLFIPDRSSGLDDRHGPRGYRRIEPITEREIGIRRATRSARPVAGRRRAASSVEFHAAHLPGPHPDGSSVLGQHYRVGLHVLGNRPREPQIGPLLLGGLGFRHDLADLVSFGSIGRLQQ